MKKTHPLKGILLLFGGWVPFSEDAPKTRFSQEALGMREAPSVCGSGGWRSCCLRQARFLSETRSRKPSGQDH